MKLLLITLFTMGLILSGTSTLAAGVCKSGEELKAHFKQECTTDAKADHESVQACINDRITVFCHDQSRHSYPHP